MEKELKEYLERIEASLSDVRTEIGEVNENLSVRIDTVEKSLSAKIDKVDRKLTKKLNDNIEYTKMLDKDISEHRRNTEAHIKPLRKA